MENLSKKQSKNEYNFGSFFGRFAEGFGGQVGADMAPKSIKNEVQKQVVNKSKKYM